MKKRLLIIAFIIGLIIVGCAPTTQTAKKPSSTQPEKNNKELAQQEYSIAYEYIKQGKYDPAIEHLKEAIKLWPKYYGAYIALAKAYRYKRNIAEAESTYNYAKKIDPKDPRAYEGLGALYSKFKRYPDAIAEFEQGLHYDSTNVNLLNGLGYIYTKTKEYDKALSYYQKSLSVEPNNLTTMFALANVYKEMGEPDKAVSYLQQLKKKRPENTEVRKKLAEVREGARKVKSGEIKKLPLNSRVLGFPVSYWLFLEEYSPTEVTMSLSLAPLLLCR